MAYSNSLNTAYQPSDIIAESYSSYLISMLDFLCFLSLEPVLLIVYPLFKLFKTLSLDESRLPMFDLFSDMEENSEEEVVETIAETMEEYMSKTRADYRSELRDDTFSSSDREDANEHTEKFLEIVDLFHTPNITQYHIMLRAFPMSLTGAEVILFYNGLEVPTRQILDSKGAIPAKTAADAKVGCELCKGPHYTKDCPLTEEGKTLKEAYYIQFGVLFQQGEQYKAAALRFYQRNNANPLYQEWRQSLKESLSKFMNESAKRHEENSNLIKEIRASMDVGAKVSVLPLSTYLNLGLDKLAHTKLIVELANRTVKRPKGIAENVLARIGKFIFPVDFIILDMLEDVKVPLILERPFLSTSHTKIDVFKRKISLRVGEEKIIFKSVKPDSSLIKRVYMLSLRERMELDLEARLMGEALVLNRSLDPLYRDYIELNDLNALLELRRNQVDDLMPTIEEGEEVDKPMIKEVKTRNDNKMVRKILDTLVVMTKMRRSVLVMLTT
nr:putative reverse transcriptase domain-containing protein [Tanacetum cinerariifolium]